MLAHYHMQETQEAVIREHTLLPTAFGLILPERKAEVELLRSARDAFAGVPVRLEDSSSWALKVLRNRDLMPQEVAKGDARSMVHALRPHATAARLVSPIGGRMILNKAFLVSREREATFDAKVRSLAARFELLTFQYTGLWSPYHFADNRLKIEPINPSTGAEPSIR
jgi:Gas vesicle synthesis protein GvpL/GvpF